MVVDDDEAVRESLRRSLTFNGYTVILAEDGEQALDIIGRQRLDGMILDVMMPKMDGLQVCRELRNRGDDLPILILTARDAISERVAGLDAGADDYLPKPFALEELLARLRSLLRRTGRDNQVEEAESLNFCRSILNPVTREVYRGDVPFPYPEPSSPCWSSLSPTRGEFSAVIGSSGRSVWATRSSRLVMR